MCRQDRGEEGLTQRQKETADSSWHRRTIKPHLICCKPNWIWPLVPTVTWIGGEFLLSWHKDQGVYRAESGAGSSVAPLGCGSEEEALTSGSAWTSAPPRVTHWSWVTQEFPSLSWTKFFVQQIPSVLGKLGWWVTLCPSPLPRCAGWLSLWEVLSPPWGGGGRLQVLLPRWNPQAPCMGPPPTAWSP